MKKFPYKYRAMMTPFEAKAVFHHRLYMAQAFATFYETWITKQENLLEQLLILSSSLSSNENDREEECNALIAQVLSHYQEFHHQKAIAANENPCLLLCPPWLTSFEKTLLWFSGFKPSMIFPLAKQGIGEHLSSDQEEKIEVMRAETRRQEKEVEKTMATLQEAIAAPPIFELMRSYGIENGQAFERDEVMENLKARMAMVLAIADGLRGSTVTKLVEILSPFQTMKFLLAAVQFTVIVRRYGLEKDAQSEATMAPDA